MSNQQTQQAQPQVAIPLPKGKKNAVQIGCICMMLSVSMYGLVSVSYTHLSDKMEQEKARHLKQYWD